MEGPKLSIQGDWIWGREIVGFYGRRVNLIDFGPSRGTWPQGMIQKIQGRRPSEVL